jgi:hypothetical protein
MELRRARWEGLGLVLILVLGAALRLYGLNWDEGHWLHPDERQVYFVTIELGWPSSLAEALSTASPLNPGFFAYGSLPFYLLKLASALLALIWPTLADPDNLHILGRSLSAAFDLGTIYLTYRLASVLLPRSRGQDKHRTVALLAAALVSFAVLHVQLAHFYTSDPPLTFFVLLTLNLAADVARSDGRWRQVGLGIAFGLALATKITAALLIVPILAACYARATSDRTPAQRQSPRPSSHPSPLPAAIRCMTPVLLPAVCVFIVAQPYALIDWQTFLSDTLRESQIAWGRLDAPYTRQYAGTLPYLYSMWQTALWGLGLPLGLIAWAALGLGILRWTRNGTWADALLLAWGGTYLAITGLLYAKYLRYMLPLLPILLILVIYLLSIRRSDGTPSVEPSSIGHPALATAAVAALLILVSSAYALSYATIYAEPHSWITASEWIYEHVPPGSTLALEEWDTALPLPLDVDGHPRRIEEYDARTLRLYGEPDSVQKWEELTAELAKSDYVIVASRRLYGSIPREPERYPLATRYYDMLFSGRLGFELVKEYTRGPAWLNPRLAPLPNAAPQWLRPDESFVVYDHPRVLIFRNAEDLPPAELLRRLQ